jgi:hypothetical protein
MDEKWNGTFVGTPDAASVEGNEIVARQADPVERAHRHAVARWSGADWHQCGGSGNPFVGIIFFPLNETLSQFAGQAELRSSSGPDGNSAPVKLSDDLRLKHTVWRKIDGIAE